MTSPRARRAGEFAFTERRPNRSFNESLDRRNPPLDTSDVISRQAAFLGLGFIVGAIAPSLSGCVEPNPDHCYNAGGDSYCDSKYGGSKPFCSDNSCVDTPTIDGCMEEEPTGCWYCDGKDEDECSANGRGWRRGRRRRWRWQR
ncbi:MAG: hypothetical protein HC888_07885 [Candidatus Competibacteraceae bacterium]|nr:hypothetical protein [Candidatus Competibacteraceae bacterium]